ncbi:hypothetical protein [Pseudobacteriovorax antillogorgiicola]|uniref:Uncharacterized protein n=1 Tax=Pseudobacteriovorax antillogorgiicola TaxID=1513793 RepID=A0A1Y6CPA1_9BACT|nr:hypothetical protein [Pseudobacteriovorax antillogorgiicola]TCS51618.1 hypothetical protein EDD56_1102 [Pseudobacteriovorax antillogorgiicola]SMF81466.1 hypothetical protein SAMN06296036_1372 [Pseudobacteriovorax antillogorgiicola]
MKDMSKAFIVALGLNSVAHGQSHTELDFETKESSMKENLSNLAQDMIWYLCEGQEDFDFDAFLWEDYEIAGLEFILESIEENTTNFCLPPDLSGMHSAVRDSV